MSSLREPPPAYVFFGVFSQFDAAFTAVRETIEEQFGTLHPHGVSPRYPFPHTDTYHKTMGGPLQRQFFVLEERQPQDSLGTIKRATIEWERAIHDTIPSNVARAVNIDPGLINDCRVILASTKDYAHRIYRGHGIWEEITLVYRKGAYRPHPWTYRDFAASTYHGFLSGFRNAFLAAGEMSSSRPFSRGLAGQ